MDNQEFKYLRIAGDISIEPVATTVPKVSVQYLIMGPTGAGKSSFVEALTGESQVLSISKDQLAGVTQHITAYKLVNVFFMIATLYHPVYLIDTPGFSDPDISEIEIMHMVREWFKANDLTHVQGILFMTPVNGTRLTGTKRRTIEMLRSFVRPSNSLGSIVFVTTMWNTLHNERTQQRGESNFEQLRDEIFKEFIDKGAVIAKFLNTNTSSLQILDNIIWRSNSFFNDESGISPHLYQDLHERIECAMQQRQTIQSNLSLQETQEHEELKEILQKNQRDNEDILIKFISQLIAFGTLPPGCERAAQRLRKSIATSDIPCPEHQELFQLWVEEEDLIEEKSLIVQPLPIEPGSTKTLTLKFLLRRLVLNVAKHRGSKWFKRKD
ncbi:hypothetical protein BJ165DRAFT_1610030 [Panaeolus papilionaceus]|nr:hypothetical protein BJ165DRAFT_1610030 [Panaeolus papilionaceus]